MRTLHLIFAATLLLPQPGQAAEEVAAVEGTVAPQQLEPLIVTSTKRDQAIDAVPASISAVSGDELRERQAWKLVEAARVLPNVHIKEATSGSAIVIRGLSTMDTSLRNSAGLYVDDVAYPLTYMQNVQLLDVERVEVLRGPQGTLYGRNSNAGVVNVVLKQPGPEAGGNVFAEYGSYNTLRTGASFSGPVLKDRLFLSGSFFRLESDGFTDNLTKNDDRASSTEYLYGRGVLRWIPADDWDLRLTLYADDTEDGVGKLRYATGPNASERYDILSNADDDAQQNSTGQSLRLQHEFGWGSVTSISSHRDYTYGFLSDLDRTARAVGYSDMNLDQQAWSQEIRLASDPAAAKLTWMLGLYGDREETDVDFNRIRMIGNTFLETSTTDTSLAVFGQATYALTDSLRLGFGLRAEQARADGQQRYTVNAIPRAYDGDLDETVFLPMVNLSHDINDRAMAYCSLSRGFLAGGFNYFTSTDEATLTYDSEYTTTAELGLKTNWLNGRFTANLALFHTWGEDKQVRQEVPGGGIGAWTFANADEVSVDGVELELTARPFSGLELTAGLGYARSEIEDWIATVNGTPYNYEGKHLPWAPDLTWHIGGAYHHPHGFFARLDVLGTGKQYFDAENTLSESGYVTLNTCVGYTFGQLEISLWGKNLLDAEYVTKQVKDTVAAVMVEDGAPRVIGTTLTWRF